MKFKTLREVPLRNYQKLQKIDEPTNIQILNILFGYKLDVIEKTSQKKIDKLTLHVQTQLEKENQLTNILTINNIDYGFIPNLDEITYGENADISQYLGDWSKMHKAMAVLYRPITQQIKDRYTIEKYIGTGERAEIMKGAPLDVVLSAIVFFYNLTKELLKCTPSYLTQQMKKDKVLSAVSETSGEDTAKFLRLHREILEDLTKSQNWDYSNV